MKKYRVTVNGTAYEIELEELTGAAPAAAAAPSAAPAAAAPAGGEQVTSPMPGTILDIKVSQGASVKKGDVLMILEAMKMENSITTDYAGTVKQILVKPGEIVPTDAVLVVVE